MIETVKVKLDGEWTVLTHNIDTGQYEATLTAPSRLSINLSMGYFPMEVEVIDDAGKAIVISDKDTLFGESLRLYVDRLYVVCDRMQEDVDNRTSRAFINAADLNRIDRNTELIGGLLATTVSVKTGWRGGGLPRSSDYERIRQNTAKIREAYGTYRDTPQVPERPYTHYTKWNDIERILHDVFYLYARNIKSKIYCGEIACGEEIGVI